VLCFINQAFINVLENMSKLEQENPLAKSHVAHFAAAAVSNGVISIAELASPLTSGFLYPLFLLCLQQLAKLKDKEWLVKAFHNSKVNLQNMLPGTSFSVPFYVGPCKVAKQAALTDTATVHSACVENPVRVCHGRLVSTGCERCRL